MRRAVRHLREQDGVAALELVWVARPANAVSDHRPSELAGEIFRRRR